jgi:hypothetical protein
MLEIGLMSQIPDTDADFDDPDDQPISIKGEPLSETIIRERRRDGGVFLRQQRPGQTSCYVFSQSGSPAPPPWVTPASPLSP